MLNFAKDGYLIVRNLLNEKQVQWANTALAELIDQDFEGVQYEVPVKEGTTLQQRRDLVRKVTHYTAQHPYLRLLSQLPSLLAWVRGILGEEAENDCRKCAAETSLDRP